MMGVVVRIGNADGSEVVNCVLRGKRGVLDYASMIRYPSQLYTNDEAIYRIIYCDWHATRKQTSLWFAVGETF